MIEKVREIAQILQQDSETEELARFKDRAKELTDPNSPSVGFRKPD